MSDDVDLEIGLSWARQRDAVYTYLRIDKKGTSTDDWDQPEEPLAIDLDRLRSLDANEAGYGVALAEMLLRPADIGAFYQTARRSTESENATLHLRLHINAPPRYHAIRWETLRDPESGHRIATDSGVLFSRYLSSTDWRPIPARPKHALRGLVAISAPTNIEGHTPSGRRLAEVDRDGELVRAQAALDQLHDLKVLAEGEAGLMPMLNAVEDGIDVLYLVCHGTLSGEVPQLFLENPDGTADLVDGRTLVERLRELDHRPTVVMLCSCQSAARGDELWTADEGELAALGPRLAEAGVAAVIAMQGDFSMESAETFGPKFFAELRKHGQVDRAMAAARRAIEDRPDWWVPVLFSRLRSGRTYYKPEFTDRADDTWKALETAMSVHYRNLTPVLGPGLADAILTSRQEMAARFVEAWQMPLTTHTRGDLAQAAQFVRVRSADGTVRAQLLHHLGSEVSNRRDKAEEGDPFWNLDFDPQRLETAICEVGRRRREMDEDDPYRVVAAIPTKVYVTTAWTNLLQEALRSAGKQPMTMKFLWNEPVDPPRREGEPKPSEEEPLVYHLFGHLEDVDSLVLSEDDYFAWFTAWLQKGRDVPKVVQTALTDCSLLFLGFRLDDWDFRVVFHAIKSFGGSPRLRRHQHAGVQLSPESALIEPEAAQEYLESYFGEDKVHIYWGEVADFLREFRARTGLAT
jgi:SIR2-like domain/CHAT domain